MTLQVASELRKDVVTFLSDVEFEYVSWVKRPANRTPSPMAKGEDMKAEFDESKHPRADDGKFSNGDGGGASSFSGEDVKKALKELTSDPATKPGIDILKKAGFYAEGGEARPDGTARQVYVRGAEDYVAITKHPDGSFSVDSSQGRASIAQGKDLKETEKFTSAKDVQSAIDTSIWAIDELNKIKTKGDDMSFEVIQSIIQPIGKDVQKLKELYGEEWFNRVKLDNKTENDGGVRFIQKSDAEFDPETALVFRDAGHGLQFAVGKLAKTVKADDTCLRIPTQVKAEGDGMVGNLEVAPMDVTVAKDPNVDRHDRPMSVGYSDDGSRSFGDILYQKSNACTDGIRAEMELSTDNVSRREKIKSYIDNYGAAIMAALDKVDAGGLKADCTAPETADEDTQVENNKSDGTVAEGDIEMNKDEITALFKDELMPSMLEVVKTTVKSELEAAAPPKEKTPEERMVELTEKLDKLLDGQKEIETIKTELAELTTKTDGLTHATATGQTGRDDGGAGMQDADQTTKGERSSWASIRPAQTSNLVIQ